MTLVRIDGSLGRGCIAGSPGFDLDKTKHWPMPGNKIQIAGLIAGRPAARDDHIPFAQQVKERCLFTLNPDEQVRRPGSRTSAALCH